MQENYYASYEFSASFYVNLCRAGFIATSCLDTQNQQILLPEIQFEYAVLHFKDLHISKKVKTLLYKNEFVLTQNQHFETVLDAIERYHQNSWLHDKYTTMLHEVKRNFFENFELVSFELCEKRNGALIAGEVGYIIGKTYTSLSGFFQKEPRYNNCGKLQLVLLSQFLEKNGFDFWNLGHACLLYKIDLGAKVYPRKEFLKLWKKSSSLPQVQNFN
jgi:Leu/Phe-tRNA-protein transferase